MDDRTFDSLVKSMATGTSRRSLLKGLLGLGGGVVAGGPMLEGDSEAARRPSPTPTPVKCPGNQIPSGGTCICPPAAPNKCGPACCATATQCCDNACCSAGTQCVAEEICCPPPSGSANACLSAQGTCCTTECVGTANGFVCAPPTTTTTTSTTTTTTSTSTTSTTPACPPGLEICAPGQECCDTASEQYMCCGVAPNEVCCLRFQCRNQGTANEFCSTCTGGVVQCSPGGECCDIFDEQHTCCGVAPNQVCCLRSQCIGQVCSPPTTTTSTTTTTTSTTTTSTTTTTPPPCKDLGEACGPNDTCCGQGVFCTDFGYCQCSPTGGGCDAQGDCCFSPCDLSTHVCVGCIPPGHDCTSTGCCTGDCVGGVCTGCFGPQFECNVDTDCCSQNCVEVSGTNPNWCDCVPDNWQCDNNDQCCSGTCASGFCQPE